MSKVFRFIAVIILSLLGVRPASAQIDYIYGQLAHPCTNLKSFVTGAINECIDPQTGAQYYWNGHWTLIAGQQGPAGPPGPTGSAGAVGPTGPAGAGANLGNYVGSVGITGNQTNGADQISKLCVNGICPVTAFGAVADAPNNGQGTDNALAVQTALTTACANNSSVYFPASPLSGGHRYGFSYPMIDSCVGTVPIYGDSSANTTLALTGPNSAGGPALVHYPPTYLTDIGTFKGASLVTGSTNSLSWATRNAFFVNLQDEIYPLTPLNGLTGFTIDGWINWAPSGNDSYTLWVSGGNDGANPNANDYTSNNAGPRNQLVVAGDGSVAGQVTFGLNINGTPNLLTVNTAITKLASHYIRAVLDPNSGTPKMCFYVDGTQVGSVLTVSGGTTIKQLFDETMAIGGFTYGPHQWPDPGPNQSWLGSILPFRISKVALNACSAATITVPTAPFTGSGNDIWMNNGNAGDFGTPALPTAAIIRNDSGGANRYGVLRGGSTQGAAMYVHDLGFSSSTAILDILSPQSHLNNLAISSNAADVAFELWNNSYSSQISNLSCNNTGICLSTLQNSVSVISNLQDTLSNYALVGTEGGYLYGRITAPGNNNVGAGLDLSCSSPTCSWLISGFDSDVESVSTMIPVKISSGIGTYLFLADDFTTNSGANVPIVYMNLLSGSPGIASIKFDNMIAFVGNSTPELVHFLNGTNPLTFINPQVNGHQWSANTTIPITDEPLNLVNIVSDQGPITSMRGYNFAFNGSGASKIPAAAASNAHQSACVADGLTACTANSTYTAADGAQGCEVFSTGSAWLYKGSRC